MLHLLPPLDRAPGGAQAYVGHARPQAVAKRLSGLLSDGALKKAAETRSMVFDLGVSLERAP